MLSMESTSNRMSPARQVADHEHRAALAAADHRRDRRGQPEPSPSWPRCCSRPSGSPPPAIGPREDRFLRGGRARRSRRSGARAPRDLPVPAREAVHACRAISAQCRPSPHADVGVPAARGPGWSGGPAGRREGRTLRRGGKVGQVLAPALAAEGHEVRRSGRARGRAGGHDAAIDFTQPDAVAPNVPRIARAGRARASSGRPASQPSDLEHSTRGQDGAAVLLRAELRDRRRADDALRRSRRPRHLPRAEIVELHHDSKLDAPSGTAKATAARLPARARRSTPCASPGCRAPGGAVRRPGPAADDPPRHPSREAFVPGVLLALSRLGDLPPGLTVGLDALLD